MNPNHAHYSRSFVLLSGGIDSATCLALAMKYHEANGGSVVAVSMDYGQRHVKEAQCAAALVKWYDDSSFCGVSHEIIDIKGFAGDCMLTNKDTHVPNTSYDLIKGVSPTYVPFRNGFMLARLAAFAQSYVNEVLKNFTPEENEQDSTALDDLCTIYFGAHAEDAKNWAYPDCTPEFVGAMSNAIYIGTYRTTRLLVPFAYSEKSDIIRKGHRLDVPYQLTWSCYKGEELHCGTCPTCRARKKAFADALITDPTKYKDNCKYDEGLDQPRKSTSRRA